ncbi:hypothetical protein VNI00_014158 [Paramarasmius palmivorus]|uniref:DUF6535 domain-containing protein n=1 Tax=Paramarasmius palmivorus TaxID=297713 RepID=A0AAW0BVS7_9AGAR
MSSVPSPTSYINFAPGSHWAGQTFWNSKSPSLDQSWECVMKEANRYDDDMVKNWKEDIDTLLVYAGLFSVVVTAFVIESYKWLTEDPADTTVALLTQISLQLVERNASAVSLTQNAQFVIDQSAVRINCFWFLSLILSLTSGLFALLCKHWLREYGRDTPTRTQAEALGLRQLRSESLQKWGVPSIVAALPILLEVALLLFFAGILDLLWARHLVPFVLATVAVGISAGMYFVTTILPSLTIPKADYGWKQVSYGFQYISPFRSPQSWAVYRMVCKLLHPLFQLSPIDNLFTKTGLWFPVKYPARDWSRLDLGVVRMFDENIFSLSESGVGYLKVYELRGLQWAVTMFRDSPSMLPHLQNVLSTLQPSVALSVILNFWQVTMWNNVTQADVVKALEDETSFKGIFTEGLDQYLYFSRAPDIPHPVLLSPHGVSLMYHQQFWIASISEFEQSKAHKATKMRFFVPFPVAGRLWTHSDPDIRKRSLFLIRVFCRSWKSYADIDLKQGQASFAPRFDDRPAFVLALSRHLSQSDRLSELLVSREGQAFIKFIHEEIIRCRLYEPWDWWDTMKMRRMLMAEWYHAIERAAQEAGHLPSERFAPIPDPIESAALDTRDGVTVVMETVDHTGSQPEIQPCPKSN